MAIRNVARWASVVTALALPSVAAAAPQPDSTGSSDKAPTDERSQAQPPQQGAEKSSQANAADQQTNAEKSVTQETAGGARQPAKGSQQDQGQARGAPQTPSQTDQGQAPKQDESSATVTSSEMPKLSDSDLQILAHIHQNDEMEVQAGQLAIKKGTTAAVKSYGQMLVDDHGANARMITAMVQKQGAALPSVQPMNEADKTDLQLAKQTMAKLQSLSGADFDREFLRSQIALHDKALAKLDQDIAMIKNNQDLVQALRGMRPVLERHRDQARTLASAMASQPTP